MARPESRIDAIVDQATRRLAWLLASQMMAFVSVVWLMLRIKK